jgi:hypothetical protein
VLFVLFVLLVLGLEDKELIKLSLSEHELWELLAQEVGGQVNVLFVLFVLFVLGLQARKIKNDDTDRGDDDSNQGYQRPENRAVYKLIEVVPSAKAPISSAPSPISSAAWYGPASGPLILHAP